MGTNYAPLVEDLLLFCYERDFRLSDDKNQADVVEAFKSTSRYLNDRGLPVGFLLIRWFGFICCCVLIFALSLFFVLVYKFWEMMRWWVGGLSCGPSVCGLGPHLSWGWGVRRWTGLSPPVKCLADRSRAVLLLWIFFMLFLSCVCYAFVCICLYVPCGHLLGGADLLALVCDV